MKITSIPQLYRNLKRWREILAVLRRYGLADWLTQFRLPFRDAFKDRGGVPLSHYSREQRVRMALTELGPTFIKLGQVLAARPDLVGPKLGDELKGLRANVRPDPIETVRKTLQAELGDDYESHFKSIDPNPLATASIGQVHRAVVNDGTKVVVKVQRADIERTLRQDLEVLAGIAQLAERVQTLAVWNPADMVRQLGPMMARELDFGRERQNLEYFAVALSKRCEGVTVPKPVSELCTKKVLVMEELEGKSIAEFLLSVGQVPAPSSNNKESNGSVTKNKKAAESDGPSVNQQLSEKIANAYLTMIFEDGLFHADPHPGNLFLLDDGQLGILDFGMCGRIDETLRESIEDILVAINNGNQSRLTRLIRKVGDAPPTLDESALAIDIADFLSVYGTQSLADFDLTAALNDLTGILHQHAIKLPNQSALLLKMLISLEGTLRELGAGFDSLEVVDTFARRSAMRRFSPMRRARQARSIYLETESFLESAPNEIVSLLKQARRGELRMSLEHQRLSPSVNRLVLGLMASAVFLGSAVMLAMKVPPLFFADRTVMGVQDLSILGIAGLAGSMTVMLWLLIAINRSGHLTRHNDD